MSENYKAFSETLTALLTDRKVSRIKLAKHLGLTNQAVSAYTLGKIFPDYENLLKIAKYFDVSLDYLVTGIRPENEQQHEELGLPDKAIENLKKLKNGEFRDVQDFINLLLSDKNFFQCLEDAQSLYRKNVYVTDRLEELEKKNGKKSIYEDRNELLYDQSIRPAARMRDYFSEFLVDNANEILQNP